MSSVDDIPYEFCRVREYACVMIVDGFRPVEGGSFELDGAIHDIDKIVAHPGTGVRVTVVDSSLASQPPVEVKLFNLRKKIEIKGTLGYEFWNSLIGQPVCDKVQLGPSSISVVVDEHHRIPALLEVTQGKLVRQPGGQAGLILVIGAAASVAGIILIGALLHQSLFSDHA